MIGTYVDGFHYEEDVSRMKYNRLGNTDMFVSYLGFGGSAIGGLNESEAHSVVKTALRKGINYIDTAPWYGFGQAEVVLGQALKSIPRKAYYLATKVGRYEQDVKKMFDFSKERTLRSVERSLETIGCEYIDLIQVHDVEFAPSIDIILNETLPALQEVKDAGKARYIGITGYPLETLKTIVDRSRIHIDTVLSYCRCCCHDTELLNYASYFKSKGIGVIDAAGAGMGLYTNNKLPDWHPALQEIKQACANAANYCKENDLDYTKLAVHFNLSQDIADTHIVGCADLPVVTKNLDVCINGLTNREKLGLDEILTRFFSKLEARNWEGVELRKYKQKLQNIN